MPTQLQDFLYLPDQQGPSSQSPEEKARDLVYQARLLPFIQGKRSAEKALQLDPHCIMAYEYLGSIFSSPPKANLHRAIVYYKYGCDLFESKKGKKYFKANTGQFWGLPETRHYMRCLNGYARCLYALDKKTEAVNIMEKMILLNPFDNQRIRDMLLLYLAELNMNEKFLLIAAMHKKEQDKFYKFNYSLFLFKTKGDTLRARQWLAKATSSNAFIAPKLLKPVAEANFPDHYSPGSESEADVYISFAHLVWKDTPGAVEWLKKYYVGRS